MGWISWSPTVSAVVFLFLVHEDQPQKCDDADVVGGVYGPSPERRLPCEEPLSCSCYKDAKPKQNGDAKAEGDGGFGAIE